MDKPRDRFLLPDHVKEANISRVRARLTAATPGRQNSHPATPKTGFDLRLNPFWMKLIAYAALAWVALQIFTR